MFKQWPQKPAIEQQFAMLERWFDSERGHSLLVREQELVEQALTQAFGYHLLQMSVDSRVELYRSSRVQRKFRCHPFAVSADVICHGEQLPFASESLDVVILHHVQEFADDPHSLLREVQRVVVPHGQVLIFGFNPWSLLGVSSWMSRRFTASHWHNHLISCLRMKDWLGLLGFEVLQVDYGMRPSERIPTRHGARADALCRRWPFGCFYLISAVKRVASFTPVKPRWSRTGNGFPALTAVKPRPMGSEPPVAGGMSETLRRSLISKKDVA